MATKVSNIEDLQKELKKLILTGMTQVGKTGEKVLKDYVQYGVYDAYRPKYYKRTGQLKKSITNNVYQIGTQTYADILHDINRDVMNPIAPYSGNNYMGQHYSTAITYNPQIYNTYVAQTVNEGSSGKMFGEGAWTKPRPYFTKAKDIMETNFSDILKKSLEKKGLSVQ